MPLTDPQAFIDRSAHGQRRVAAWLVLANVAIAVLLSIMAWQVLDASLRSYEG